MMQSEKNDAALTAYQSGDLFREVNNAIDLETALALLRKIDLLGALLKQQQIYADNAVAYNRLHAEAIIKIVELGGNKELRGYTRKAAEWLVDASVDERDNALSMLAD